MTTSEPRVESDLADPLGEIDASQRDLEAAIAAVDQAREIDLARYVTARARLDAAVADWNHRIAR